VKHDQPHPLQNAFMDSLDHRILHLSVSGVAPPGEDIGPRKNLLCQPVFGLLKRRSADFEFAGLREPVGNALMHPGGIDFANGFVLLFVDVFSPDGNADE